MSKLIRYGILGCGMMGREHLQNLALIESAEVVAIAEPNAEMRERAKPLAGNAIFVDSLDELLKLDTLDALVIATPNYQHADQLLQILAETKLPVLVEKPIVTTLEDVQDLYRAASDYPAPVWVAMEYRYMPPIADFYRRLQNNEVGVLKTISIKEHRFPFLQKVDNWNRFNKNSGGTLVEKCCHFFDLLRLLSQSEVRRVYASAGQDNNHLDESYDGKTPDIIDNAYVVLDFACGKRGLLELNMFAEGSQYQEEITAIGSDAKLECFVPGPSRTWPNDKQDELPTPKVVLSPRHPKGPTSTDVIVDPKLLAAGDHNGATYYQHLGFHRAIQEGTPVEVSLIDGLKAAVIGLAAQRSASTGEAVVISDDGLYF